MALPSLKALLMKHGPSNKQMYSLWPEELVTGLGPDTKPRVRVDVGQTGFFEGREFRAFWDGTIAAGATQVLRITVPINIIVFEQLLNTDASSILLTALQGGTSGGTFTDITSIFRKNEMTPVPAYTRQVSIATGGNHTGGTTRDITRMVSNVPGSAAASIGGVAADERGLAAGTYYVRLNNYGASSANVTYKLFWEERPVI